MTEVGKKDAGGANFQQDEAEGRIVEVDAFGSRVRAGGRRFVVRRQAKSRAHQNIWLKWLAKSLTERVPYR